MRHKARRRKEAHQMLEKGGQLLDFVTNNFVEKIQKYDPYFSYDLLRGLEMAELEERKGIIYGIRTTLSRAVDSLGRLQLDKKKYLKLDKYTYENFIMSLRQLLEDTDKDNKATVAHIISQTIHDQ